MGAATCSFPNWRGSLFSGGLESQDVRRIILDKDGRVTGQDRLEIGERVQDVRQGPDGFLYVLSDEKNGRLCASSQSRGSPAAALGPQGVRPPDFVIAVPPRFHLELALAALAAGKHVLVEKLAFLTMDDYETVRPAWDRPGASCWSAKTITTSRSR